MKVLLDHFKYKCHSSLKVKADFLVVLDELAKKNNMDEKEMVKIIKKWDGPFVYINLNILV